MNQSIGHHSCQNTCTMLQICSKTVSHARINYAASDARVFQARVDAIKKKINVVPKASMKVSLPIKVQKAVDSWKKWGRSIVRYDGSQVLIAVLSGLVSDYALKTTDEIL